MEPTKNLEEIQYNRTKFWQIPSVHAGRQCADGLHHVSRISLHAFTAAGTEASGLYRPLCRLYSGLHGTDCLYKVRPGMSD